MIRSRRLLKEPMYGYCVTPGCGRASGGVPTRLLCGRCYRGDCSREGCDRIAVARGLPCPMHHYGHCIIRGCGNCANGPVGLCWSHDMGPCQAGDGMTCRAWAKSKKDGLCRAHAGTGQGYAGSPLDPSKDAITERRIRSGAGRYWNPDRPDLMLADTYVYLVVFPDLPLYVKVGLGQHARLFEEHVGRHGAEVLDYVIVPGFLAFAAEQAILHQVRRDGADVVLTRDGGTEFFRRSHWIATPDDPDAHPLDYLRRAVARLDLDRAKWEAIDAARSWKESRPSVYLYDLTCRWGILPVRATTTDLGVAA